MSTSVAVAMEEHESVAWQATGTDGGANLKQVAAERLAAHRHRRASVAAREAEQETRSRQMREAARQAQRDDQRRGASAVRDTVKARYERRESYREFLAAEAERAIEQAQAEAEVAARSARAVTESQMQLLEELEQLNRPDPGPREVAFAHMAAEARGELAHALADIVLGAKELMAEPSLRVVENRGFEKAAEPEASYPLSEPEAALREISSGGLTVRLFEDMPATPPRPDELNAHHGAQTGRSARFIDFADTEVADTLHALEQEIDFRRDPEFPETAAVETRGIPGNLIEFPRELVAPRRARPRLAEGPLREEGEPQLRIFEVDALQESAEPEAIDVRIVPDWQNMMLESATVEEVLPPVGAQLQITVPPQTASLERRFMSAAVDASLIVAGWFCALGAVAEVCGPALRSLSLPVLVGSALVSLGLCAVLFQVLFFSLSESTPGMRWARIGLCTFGDGNPSRRAMRRRIFSTLLAACPLGLGLAWVWMDNDRMGWHDRMSRMYQRAY